MIQHSSYLTVNAVLQILQLTTAAVIDASKKYRLENFMPTNVVFGVRPNLSIILENILNTFWILAYPIIWTDRIFFFFFKLSTIN